MSRRLSKSVKTADVIFSAALSPGCISNVGKCPVTVVPVQMAATASWTGVQPDLALLWINEFPT